MSVIPTTVAAPVATAVPRSGPSGARSVEGGTAAPDADARVGDVFAALVDALGAELEGDANLTADAPSGEVPAAAPTEEPAVEGATGEAAALGADAVVAAAVVATTAWPPVPLPPPAASAQAAVGASATPVPSAASPAGPETDAMADAVSALVEQAGDGPVTPPTTDALVDAVAAPATSEDPAGGAAAPAEAPATADVDAPVIAADIPGAAPPDATPVAEVHASPIAPVTGASATSARAEVAAGEPTRAAAPALPEQLVEVVAPLRKGPDGTHRVALQLRPDELGEVLVDVRIRGNEVSLSLRADLPGTTDMLRSSLAELRSELEASGFRPGHLDVGAHGGGRHAPERKAAPTATAGAASAEGEPAGVARRGPATTSSPAGLDVRI